MAISKLKRDGKIKYRAEAYIDGVRVDSRYCDTKSEAIVWIEAVKKKHSSGYIKNKMTVGECVREYRDTDYKELRLSTQQAKAARFGYLLTAPLTNIPMGKLSADDIDSWLDWLKSHSTTMNKNRKSFIHELKLLNVICNWYREMKDHTFINPILNRHRRKKVNFKVVKPRRSDFYMRKEEVAKWLSELQRLKDPVYYRIGLFMVMTGWRLGEACGLHWDSLALECNPPIARVERTMWWDYKTKEPRIEDLAKTSESIRFVPLPVPVVDMLKDLKANQAKIGVVFRNLKGNMLKDVRVRENFNKAFERAGIPWSGTHICRHTFSTLSLYASRDQSGLQAILGHKSAKHTEKYAKITALMDSDITTQTSDYLGVKYDHSTNHSM